MTKKTDKPDGEPVLWQRTFSSVFRAVFYTVKPAQFNLECMGPFTSKTIQPAHRLWVHHVFHTMPKTEDDLSLNIACFLASRVFRKRCAELHDLIISVILRKKCHINIFPIIDIYAAVSIVMYVHGYNRQFYCTHFSHATRIKTICVTNKKKTCVNSWRSVGLHVSYNTTQQ